MATRGRDIRPPRFFLCPHTEQQFDKREPVAVCVRIVDVPVRGNSAPILHGILFHGGEGRELPEDPRRSMATRERLNRADKNGASIVPPLVSPLVPHRTLRHTHRIIRSPIATSSPSPHHDIPHASRQPRIAPTQRHPIRITGRTRIEQQQRREKTRR